MERSRFVMDAPVTLRGLGSFFVGGRSEKAEFAEPAELALALNGPVQRLEQNGDYEVGQMYVQAFLPAKSVSPHPLLLWHGGGMTGVTWETTPDGRVGWAQKFLAAGHDVYVSDAVERGRASFPPPALCDGPPIFRSKAQAWETFRLGPAAGYDATIEARRPFPEQRFPILSFDAFCRQFVARWPALQPLVREAYRELVEPYDGAVVVAHSQGGGYALETALARPDHIRALVLIEPSGAPRPDQIAPISGIAAIPHLIVWGDFFEESDLWRTYRGNVEAYVEVLRETGARVDVLDLPARGIAGNSHFPMMDDNSDLVFDLVAEWLADVL